LDFQTHAEEKQFTLSTSVVWLLKSENVSTSTLFACIRCFIHDYQLHSAYCRNFIYFCVPFYVCGSGLSRR